MLPCVELPGVENISKMRTGRPFAKKVQPAAGRSSVIPPSRQQAIRKSGQSASRRNQALTMECNRMTTRCDRNAGFRSGSFWHLRVCSDASLFVRELCKDDAHIGGSCEDSRCGLSIDLRQPACTVSRRCKLPAVASCQPLQREARSSNPAIIRQGLTMPPISADDSPAVEPAAL